MVDFESMLNDNIKASKNHVLTWEEYEEYDEHCDRLQWDIIPEEHLPVLNIRKHEKLLNN